jgi:hypothetical protein
MSDIEGKAARVAASERGQRASFKWTRMAPPLHAGAIAEVMVSSGTMAKCSVPFSS